MLRMEKGRDKVRIIKENANKISEVATKIDFTSGYPFGTLFERRLRLFETSIVIIMLFEMFNEYCRSRTPSNVNCSSCIIWLDHADYSNHGYISVVTD